MDITVYLPDEIGTWAKDNDLKLSAMLRAAVTEERDRRAAVARTLGDSAVHELRVEGRDGPSYAVRVHGALIAEQHGGPAGDVYVYLTEDERLFVHGGGRLDEVGDRGDLRDLLYDDDAYIAAMDALGAEAVIDIGQAGR